MAHIQMPGLQLPSFVGSSDKTAAETSPLTQVLICDCSHRAESVPQALLRQAVVKTYDERQGGDEAEEQPRS
jgi:hypothetical protein